MKKPSFHLLAAALLWAGGITASHAQTPVPSTGSPARAAASPTAGAEDPNSIRVLLSPELETTLVAQMIGRISSLQAQIGSRVQKGKIVVGFDCGEASARLHMAQAEHAAAKETLGAKERLRKLEAAGDVEVALATAEADKSRAAIALARTQMTQCTVAAPFNGRVVKVHVKPHQGVNVGAPLVDLISDGPLKLRLNVPSRWLKQLRIGTSFEVTISETGQTYPARITAINGRVDAVAQTIELEARLDKAELELLAGMSGTARFRLAP